MHIHNKNKEVIHKYRKGLYDLNVEKLESHINTYVAADAELHIAHPFEAIHGSQELYERVYRPLTEAIPDLERRDYIVMAGNGKEGDLAGNWIGCAGFYTGIFARPWLDIPPTGHPVAMRFHEFYQVEGERIVAMQALWDIPQVMMQAKAWPMTPSLGVEWLTPGPATQDGIITADYDAEKAATSYQLIMDMLTGLQRHKDEGAEAMGLEQYWHPKMLWYGPAGIGTNRRISGFRNWHQIPFLKAMPDREGSVKGNPTGILFADHDYVAVTGWPNMTMTISGDGWLGIPPVDKSITMRSLDFWRCENGLIRENWVLVDLLHVYHQLGVDVFSRMRELSYPRQSKHYFIADDIF